MHPITNTAVPENKLAKRGMSISKLQNIYAAAVPLIVWVHFDQAVCGCCSKFKDNTAAIPLFILLQVRKSAWKGALFIRSSLLYYADQTEHTVRFSVGAHIFREKIGHRIWVALGITYEVCVRLSSFSGQ